MAKTAEDIKEDIESLYFAHTGFGLDFTQQILVKSIAEVMEQREEYFESMINGCQPAERLIGSKTKDIKIPRF